MGFKKFLPFVFILFDACCSHAPLIHQNVKFENCAAYPGGEKVLTEIMESGLGTGLSCISNLGGERANDARKLKSFFANSSPYQITIQCAHSLQVLGTRSDGKEVKLEKTAGAESYGDLVNRFPAIAINLDTPNSSDLPETFFHETLHWLGYKHSVGVDITYLSSICCFSKKSDLKKMACSLLQKNLDWESLKYQTEFSALMEKDGRPVQGISSVWFGTLEPKKNNPRAKINPIGLYQAAEEIIEQKHYPFTGRVFARVASTLLTHVSVANPPTLKPEQIAFEESLATIIAAALGGRSAMEANHAWKRLKAIEPKACEALGPVEREATQDIISIVYTSLFQVEPKLNTDLLVNFGKLCSTNS